jgi:hypothetical protein
MDKVFPDEAVCASDCFHLYATILEITGDSYCRRAAAGRWLAKSDVGATTDAAGNIK